MTTALHVRRVNCHITSNLVHPLFSSWSGIEAGLRPLGPLSDKKNVVEKAVNHCQGRGYGALIDYVINVVSTQTRPSKMIMSDSGSWLRAGSRGCERGRGWWRTPAEASHLVVSIFSNSSSVIIKKFCRYHYLKSTEVTPSNGTNQRKSRTLDRSVSIGHIHEPSVYHNESQWIGRPGVTCASAGDGGGGGHGRVQRWVQHMPVMWGMHSSH